MATRKAELKKQRDEIRFKIDALRSELKPINDALAEIAAYREQDAIDALSKQYGVFFEVGKEFIVTQAIADYAKERKFGDGYYRSWLVGQTATINQINPYSAGHQIRAECFTGHIYDADLGGGRTRPQKLMSLDTPIPIELIAEALHGN